jgi:predicted nucleic acid-binding protein
MIFLDTNVISELMREESDGTVARWLDHQIAASVWTTSVVEMEVRYGIESLATGRRREVLERTFEKFLEEVLEFRVAAFDRPAARAAAELMADRRRRGRPGEIRDTLIAGIALASNATVATRNVAHFADLNIHVVNPWEKL